MYDVPKEYRAAIRSPTRNDRMAGKLTLTDGSTIELTDSAVISGSVSVDNQCVSGQELAFGSVYMGQASLQLRTALSSAAFYDAALQIDYEIQLADGSWYTLPVGRYTVAEAERSAAVVSLTGYDNMLKLERKFSGSAILGNAYTMLTQIAGTCGRGAGAKRGGDQGPLAQRRDPAPARRQLPGLHLARLRGGHCPTYWPGLPPSTGWAGCGSCSLERRPA